MNVLRLNKYGVLTPPPGVKLIIPKITLGSSSDMWGRIEELIQDYTKVHPEEMRIFLEANRWARGRQKNSFGSTDDNNLRWGLNIPPGLDSLLNRFFPDLFNGVTGKKNFRKFMRKFPGFRICDVV